MTGKRKNCGHTKHLDLVHSFVHPNFMFSNTFLRGFIAGPDKNCYYNEKFLRNKRFLSHQIRRTSIKGHGPRRPYAHLTNVPNFYTMPFLPVTVHEASPLPLPSKTKQDREPSRSAEDPPFSSLLGQYSEGGSYKSSAGDDLLLGTMQSTQHQSRSKPGLLGIASLLSTCMQRNGTNAHGNPSFPVGNERSVLPDASTPLQQLQRAYISRAQEQQQLDTLTKSIQHAFQQNSLQQQNPSFPGNGGWNTHTHPMMGGGGALAVGLLPTTAPNLSSLMALSIPTMAVPSHSATLSNNNWVFSNQVRGGGTSSFTAHPPPPPPPLFVTLTNNNVNNSIFGTNTNSSDDSSVRERILQLLHHQQQQQQQQQSPSIPFSFAGWF